MSTVTPRTETSDKPVILQGEKIRSHMHRFNQNSVTALSGYSVSMNTRTQNWHPKRNTTLAKIKNENTKALETQHITIQSKNGTDEKDKAITFYLPKEQGNYRAEITNFSPIDVAAKSIYLFDFKAIHLPDDLVLFQVRELGGSMQVLGGDRPPFSLHIKQDGTLVATINTVNQNSGPTAPDNKTYQNENIPLNKIKLGEYHHFTIEMVMHRDHPSIKISIGDEKIYQRDTPFGASDSKTFYSKLGAYVPQQKDRAGVNDSEISFDNIKEAHYQYIPPIIIEENSAYLAGSETHNSLPVAMTVFDAEQDGLANVDLPSVGEHLLVLATTIMAPTRIF